MEKNKRAEEVRRGGTGLGDAEDDGGLSCPRRAIFGQDGKG